MAFGRHLVTVAAVVPLVLLGACSGDDPEPTFSPPSQSPSASESSPTEPVVRPWEKKTEAGAVAFAKHWIDVFNEAAASGDVAGLQAISGGGCETCTNFVDLIEEIHSDGTFESDGGWRVIQTSKPEELKDGLAVALRIKQPPEKVIRPGKPVERHPGGKVTYSAELKWMGTSWTMGRLYLLS